MGLLWLHAFFDEKQNLHTGDKVGILGFDVYQNVVNEIEYDTNFDCGVKHDIFEIF